jgi:hypothetical protein
MLFNIHYIILFLGFFFNFRSIHFDLCLLKYFKIFYVAPKKKKKVELWLFYTDGYNSLRNKNSYIYIIL